MSLLRPSGTNVLYWLSRTLVAFAVALLGIARVASADSIPYPSGGSYNPITYTFSASVDGDVIAYIVGGFSAGFENQLGLEVNGVLSAAGFGLDNHTSAVGDSFNFGPVHAGDSLVFVLQNLSLAAFAYSDPGRNVPYDAPGVADHNHIYSTSYTATAPVFPGVPVGTYVAFEDLPFPGADFNYDDESFVFTGVSSVEVPTPEPATLMLLASGLFIVARRFRRKSAP